MVGQIGRVGQLIGRVGGGVMRVAPPPLPPALDFLGGLLPPGVAYARAGSSTALTATLTERAFAADIAPMTDAGLLLESAATNIAPNSAAFALLPANWAPSWSRDPVRPVAPDGTATGVELIGPNAATTLKNMDRYVLVPGGPFSFSVYVQAEWMPPPGNFNVLARNDTTATQVEARSIPTPFVAGTYGAFALTKGPGDWWRLTGAAANGFGAGDLLGLYLGFTGAMANGARIRLWGLHVQPGSGPLTSRIPTGASAATRGQPSLSVTVPAGAAGWRTTHNGGLTATGVATPGQTLNLYAALLAADRIGLGRELQRLEWTR